MSQPASFEYSEPSIINILIVISFFVLLALSRKALDKLIGAGLIGQIIVGIIFGTPLAGILEDNLQASFLVLGYIGLIGLVFEGGLNSRLDLVLANLPLSTACALLGVILPIAFSILLIHFAYGYTVLEGFIAGAALSATSLGTTFAIIKSSPFDLVNTRVGAVLTSAAVIDDVVALIMSKVIESINEESSNLGWTIGRPILASIGLIIVTAPVAWVLKKLMHSVRNVKHFKGEAAMHLRNLSIMSLLLLAGITIAHYAGTSLLLGAYLAGITINHSDQFNTDTTFSKSFEIKVSSTQRLVFEALFFASIGYCIPFLSLWTEKAIWQGLIYSLIMLLAKFAVGILLILRKDGYFPGLLLGSGMIARGEIGLLISQLGFSNSPQLLILTTWAITVNTIMGPVMVSLILRLRGHGIIESKWGTKTN